MRHVSMCAVKIMHHLEHILALFKHTCPALTILEILQSHRAAGEYVLLCGWCVTPKCRKARSDLDARFGLSPSNCGRKLENALLRLTGRAVMHETGLQEWKCEFDQST